jgi:hypothetical protein
MALSYKAGFFTKVNTTTGYPFDQDVTDVGFQPKALFLWCSTTSSSVSDRWRSFITMDGGVSGQHRCIMFGSEDALTTPVNFRAASDVYSVRQTTSGVVEVLATISFLSTGFRLTYEQNSASTFNIAYLAIGGGDVTDVKVGSFTPNTTTGNQSITDVGFQPDITFFMGLNTPVPTATATVDHNNYFFGVAKSSTERVVMAGASPEAGASNPQTASRVSRTDKCIMYYSQTPSINALDCHADYVGTTSSGSGGFTINITDAPVATANPIFYMAIKGGSWKVGSATAPTTAGTQAVTSQGFTPKGLLLFGHGDTADPTGATSADFGTNNRISFGAADAPGSTTKWHIFSGDKAGVNPTVTVRGWVANGAIFRSVCENATAASSVITSSATLTTFDSTSSGRFVLDWTATDGVPRQLLYVTTADTPVGGQSIVKVVGAENVGITESAVKVLVNIPSETLPPMENNTYYLMFKFQTNHT